MVITGMFALWQADTNPLTTILQTTPAERLAFEDEDMFFPSMHKVYKHQLRWQFIHGKFGELSKKRIRLLI